MIIYTPVHLVGGRHDGKDCNAQGSPAYLKMVTPMPRTVQMRYSTMVELFSTRHREEVYVRTADFTPDMRRIYQLKTD
jgi:hypothetical protein